MSDAATAELEAPVEDADAKAQPAVESEAPEAAPEPQAEAAAPEPAAEEAAAPAEESAAPIIVKKVIADGHGGAHGGAWKIALADMMTAMMAFFLLMWLLGASNEDQRKSIAEYFKPTSQSSVEMGKLVGSDGMFGGSSIIDPDGTPFRAKQTNMLNIVTPRSQGGPTENDPSPQGADSKESSRIDEEFRKKMEAEQASFEKLEKDLKESLEKNPNLKNLKDQVQFARDKDGLRIEIIDKADFAMFGLGTTSMTPRAQALIQEVGKLLAAMPNKVALRGHTDSLAFANTNNRNNWTLSAERAEETRKNLERQGIQTNRFARIEGVADTVPYNPNDPKDPRNRRISITVLNNN